MSNAYVSWRYSVFTKLIIVFLIIMIPFLILAALTYEQSRKELSSEISSSMKLKIMNYLDNFDDEIERIKRSQFDLSQDYDINQLINESDLLDNYERTKVIQRIQNHLSEIKNSSVLIEAVRLFIPSISLAINAEEDSNGGYNSITDLQVSSLYDSNVDNEFPLISKHTQLYSIIPFPQYEGSSTNALYLIQIVLSKSALQKELLQLKNSENAEIIMQNEFQPFQITLVNNENTVSKYHDVTEKLVFSESSLDSVKINQENYLVIYGSSRYTGMSLFVFLLESEAFKSVHRLGVWYWVSFILIILAISIFCYYLYKSVRKPLMSLLNSFRKVPKDDFDLQIEYEHSDEIGYLYGGFDKMIAKLKILINQVYTQKILTQKAELKQLQSQINPHFLYNTYFLLHRLILREDYENATIFSEQIGRYFQFITRNGADEISLEDEVKHSEIYVNIQSMRFSGRIRTSFCTLPDEFAEIRVPRLILQPIIENVFEHGLKDKSEDGLLLVTFADKENGIRITVEDNGDALSDESIQTLSTMLQSEDSFSEITGIININRRLKLFFQNESGITVSRSGLGGLKVIIYIVNNRIDKIQKQEEL